MTSIPALVKFRFHDFIVDEIFDGEPVELTEAPPVYPQFQKTLDALNPDPNAPTPDLNPVLESLEFTDEQKEKIRTFILAKEPNSKLLFECPASADKIARTGFHQAIRALGYPMLESGAPNGQLSLHFHAKVQLPAMGERSRFWNFVLLKRDVDTMQAIQALCRASCKYQRLTQQHISYAGVKDQRGVTQQICQIPGYYYPEGLCMQLPSNLALGNFRRTDTLVKLGSHQGNRFTVTLRAIGTGKAPTLTAEQIASFERNLYVASTTGIPNAFGTQRFGTSVVPTDKMGLALVQGRFRLFLRYLIINDYQVKHGFSDTTEQELCYRFAAEMTHRSQGEISEDPALEANVSALLEKFAATVKQTWRPNQLARLLQEFKKPILELEDEEIYKTLSAVMSRSQLTFYFHAFQSRIFNDAAEGLFSRTAPQEGDLVLGPYGEPVLITPENAGLYDVSQICLPLVGFQTLLPGPAWQAWLSKVRERYGFQDISPAYRNIFAPGGFRPVFTRVSGLSVAGAVHSTLEEQFWPTGFDPVGSVSASVELQSPDNFSLGALLEKAREEDAYASVVLRFTLPASAYATETLGFILGETVTHDSQMEMLKTLGVSAPQTNDSEPSEPQ